VRTSTFPFLRPGIPHVAVGIQQSLSARSGCHALQLETAADSRQRRVPRVHCRRALPKAVLARCRAESAAQQVVVVGQVLASEINIGFEDIVNTQVRHTQNLLVQLQWCICSQGRSPRSHAGCHRLSCRRRLTSPPRQPAMIVRKATTLQQAMPASALPLCCCRQLQTALVLLTSACIMSAICMCLQILRINDKPVGNLREVVAAIDGATTPFLRLDMDYDQVDTVRVVSTTENARAVSEVICTQRPMGAVDVCARNRPGGILRLCTDRPGCCPSNWLWFSYCPHQTLQAHTECAASIHPSHCRDCCSGAQVVILETAAGRDATPGILQVLPATSHSLNQLSSKLALFHGSM
jgi:PDZ domain